MLALFTRLLPLTLGGTVPLRYAVVAVRVGDLDVACAVCAGRASSRLVLARDRRTGAVELARGTGRTDVETLYDACISFTVEHPARVGAVRVGRDGSSAFRVEAGDLALSGTTRGVAAPDTRTGRGVVEATLAAGHLVVGGRETVLRPGARALVAWSGDAVDAGETSPALAALAGLLRGDADPDAAGRRLSEALDAALAGSDDRSAAGGAGVK